MLLTGTAKHTEMKLASAVCLFAAQLAHMMRSALAEPLVFDSGLRPRLQWLHNDGYCAEVSAAMAGLKFGQYFSQYDVREIAAVSQNNVQTSQSFLVGFNDQQASAKLRLGYIEFPSSLEEVR